MSSGGTTKILIELAQQNWQKIIGLVCTIAAAFIIETVILVSTKTSGIPAIIVYSITAISVIIIWFYSKRIPKIPKGKVGFVVCIQYSNKIEEQTIREDFIKTLRRLLMSGPVGQTFHFLEMPQHISESINDIYDAHALRSKTRSHFLIFGRVRLRNLGGQDHHVFELDGIVAHKPLEHKISAQLSSEFGELFPRRLHISTENDLLSLNFTSEWTECVAKYIIGIASSCSLDLDYAEHLYRDVQSKLSAIQTDFPIFAKLKQRLPIRFSEIYIARSKICIKHWQKTKDQTALSPLASNLSKISPLLADNYQVLLLRGIEAFLNGRRIRDAIEYTKKCSLYDDPVWHLNLAFLRAYQKNLVKSIKQYRICTNYDLSPITLAEVEDFIVWILKEEPEKYQYYYCLGFFNWKIKEDLHRAVDDFEEFLKHVKEEEFIKEREQANEWIVEIKEEIAESNK
jgi:hypothetical protein